MRTGSPKFWFWTALLLTAAKLWLTRGQPVFALGAASHDDQLYVRLASYLTQGEWLGPYNQFTLAKGSFYPLWIALASLLSIPLFLSQHLLYAGACAAFVQACAPSLKSGGTRFVIYAALLWNPMTYEARTLSRVLRQHVYVSLTLLIIAGLVALYFRHRENFRRQTPWAIMLGLAAGAFWLTREEGIWLIPAIVILLAAFLVAAWRTSRPALVIASRSVALAASFALLPVILVAWQNDRHYGWFGTVEMRSSALNDAYGALLRITTGPDIPFVPVTRQAREAAYAVSPAFAQLKPHLDGDVGQNWAASSEFLTHLPAQDRQIGGGWFIWALRDSTSNVGHATSAAAALAFYRQVADEINAACDDGRLPAGPRRSGFMPPWKNGQTASLIRTTTDFAGYLFFFRSFTAYAPPSEGSPAELKFFEEMTGERLSTDEDPAASTQPYQAKLNQLKVESLQSIGKGYRAFLAPALWFGLAVFLLRTIDLFIRRKPSFAYLLAWVSGASCLIYAALNALIDVTSYPLLAVSTFAPAYPLVIVTLCAIYWDACVAWFPFILRKAAA